MLVWEEMSPTEKWQRVIYHLWNTMRLPERRRKVIADGYSPLSFLFWLLCKSSIPSLTGVHLLNDSIGLYNEQRIEVANAPAKDNRLTSIYSPHNQ